MSPAKHFRRLLIAAIAAALGACGGDGVDLGPTIADLESMPPIIDSVELEPRATFEIDRQQVIDSFRALVEITADGGGTGDELRRLADLELELSLEQRLADDETERQLGIAATLQAIGIYEAYLEKYPGNPDNDKILYQLSRAYAIEADETRSLAALDRIAREFPASQYIDEVQFRRGEILFVMRDFPAAEAAYGAIVGDQPDSLFFDKALYKYGWAQFKQSRYDDALASYTRLLDLNLERGKIGELDFNPALERGERELLEDVVRLATLCFSYQDEERSIAQHFNANGKRDYEPLLYRKLGELYLAKERILDGSGLFLAYTDEYPYSPHAPYFHTRAIETFQQAGYSDLVLKEKIAYVDRYDVGSEYWSVQSPETRRKLKPALAGHIGELATHFHAQARASKRRGDYGVAAGWYRRYLKSFPDADGAPRMNFLLAESLTDAGQLPQAIDAYQQTAYGYPRHADSAEAGYAALVSFDALFKTTNASDVPALRRQRIQSAVRFTTSFPEDPRLAKVELQTAQQFFEWQEYDDAIASSQRLIASPQVDKKTRQTAWAILADSQFSSDDFAGAEKSYLALLEFLPARGKARGEAREQVAASIYKQGEAARAGGDHLLAASHFSRLGQVIPESPKRIVADYDAATAYVQLEDWDASIRQLEAFRKRYPRDKKFTVGVAEKLALAYSQTGDEQRAAGEMLALAKLPGDAGRKRDLMWRAAEIYEQSGDTNKAIAIYQDYVTAYPFPLARSIELRHKIAESYRTRNDRRNLNFWLNEIVRADARGGKERSDRSRYLAATASLELIEPLQRNYRKARLTVPLKKSLATKKRLMQQSIDAYTKAMNYQVAEVTTAATYQIGEIYHDFARSLLESERPRGLSDEELEEYDLLLEEQAIPFEEKAIDIHLANFKRIPAGTYDEPIKKSLAVLGELMPFRFARMESTDAYVEIQ